MMSIDGQIVEFVAAQRRLLTLELASDDDIIRDATRIKHNNGETTSQALFHLFLQNVSVGLFGRTVVTLGLNDDILLPAHRFTTGDEVQIVSSSDKSRERNQGGVVCEVSETFISIALFGQNSGQPKKEKTQIENEDEETMLGNPPFTLLPRSSMDVHNKMMQALSDLERNSISHPLYGNIVKAVFSGDQSSHEAAYTAFSPFNSSLDESQLGAISFSLEPDRYLSLIHGPPGTGKTSTVAELIQQAVKQHGYKILVTAPSNVAVDNVLERLVQSETLHRKGSKSTPRIRAVRLGHPARIKAAILRYSLEAQVQADDGTDIVRDVRHELEGYLQVLLNPKSRGLEKRKAYQEVKLLRKEVRQRETKVVQQLLQQAQVILCTNVGAANKILHEMEFDLVIIDEAAQALEASCWIPILKGKRLVLAGDHCQLPPTVKSNNASVQKGLSVTLFERIMNIYKNHMNHVSRMLKVQYRMHHQIADWASKSMYHEELQTHKSVAEHKLCDLPHYKGEENIPTLLLIDTAGCGMEESENAAGSRYNEGEAKLIVAHVQYLLNHGLRTEDIAVISPYNGQVELLKTLLLPEIAPKLEIRSVDGFQGGEREAVILSLVRSNLKGIIGFLGDARRLNVAVTRAKRHCAIICDTETVTKSKYISELVTWMETYGDYRSAFEFQTSDIHVDFECADLELKKLMEVSKPTTHTSTTKKVKKLNPNVKEDHNNHLLLKEVDDFANSGAPGDEKFMAISLSANDRRLVHERATALGIDHFSVGTEGIDRRILLRIPDRILPGDVNKVEESVQCHDQENPFANSTEKSESELHVADVISDVEKETEIEEQKQSKDSNQQEGMNDLLSRLALERKQRAQGTKTSNEPVVAPQKDATKHAKRNGQRLGGGKAQIKPKETLSDTLDDMEFLDAQINQVQNSHGRKVDGVGGYKTIINGILISKPPPISTKKNNQGKLSVLNAKIKAAQDDRKPKGGKKKK